MKIKCPRCQAAITYDIASQSMQCEYCGSIFGMSDIATDHFEPEKAESEAASESSAPEPESASEKAAEEEMTCKMMSCSSCGANLMVNETESATFCAYCGQPTLVMDRITKQKRPKYILPFKIKKEEAEEIVRRKFAKGFFVPQSVKNFKVDKLHGVYIPYRMVDVYCQDEMVIKAEHKSSNRTTYSYHYRKALNTFKQVTVDASNQLSDESSVRLEPYKLDELTAFDPAYFSGFYANCMDTPVQELEKTASQRALLMFHEEAMKTVSGGSSPEVVVTNPYTEIEDSTYIMLPAWFLSFTEGGKNYTMMVNGQTGKCVGAVPPVRAKVKICTALLAVLLSPVCVSILRVLFQGDEVGKIVVGTIFAIAVLFFSGKLNFEKINKSCELTCAQDMKSFANDRQEVHGI